VGRVCLENDLPCIADEAVLLRMHTLIIQALRTLQQDTHGIWTMHNASVAHPHFHQLLFLWHLPLQHPTTAASICCCLRAHSADVLQGHANSCMLQFIIDLVQVSRSLLR
jgi:hypothetical protein